jgi:hypothetical protein
MWVSGQTDETDSARFQMNEVGTGEKRHVAGAIALPA